MDPLQDPLLGFWENDADDGSGLHAIWGYGLEFYADGTGVELNWGHDVKEENKKLPFRWKRTGPQTVAIQQDPEDEWEEIEYEITPYALSYLQLTAKGQEGFWTAPEPICKRIK
jgi:hypothetical protein